MALMPVVTREMSVLARRRSTYWARAVTATLAVLTMMWLLLVSAARVPLASVGSSIFFTISGLCFVFALLVGMQATADSVSEEKREGTLGLLFLTDLKAIHIVLGKMAASSLNAFFAVLGIVPMLALALLLGGVTLPEVGLTAVVLMNSMFLSLSLGIFVSTLSENERKAMFACFVSLFLLTVMPFVLAVAMTIFDGFGQRGEFFEWVSPLYVFLRVQNVPGLTAPYLTGVGLVFQHLLGWIFLFAASRILPRCIHEGQPGRFARLRAMVDNYAFGKAEVRKLHRATLLDRNAFLWLASRERAKPKYAWTVVAFFGLLFLWVGTEFPNMFFDPPVPLIIIFLVHSILKLWTASEVCSRLISDRRSGALELLLSSPLSVREIAEGQTLALRRIFRWPVIVLLLAELVVLKCTWSSAREDMARQSVVLFAVAMTSLVLDLWALKWVGLWLSLFGKSIERVLIATIGRVLGVPTVLFVAIGGTLGAVVALQNESVPAMFMYVLFWATGTVCSLAFGLTAKRSFFAYFREAAAQRFDASGFRAERRAGLKGKRRLEGLPFGRAILRNVRRRWVTSGTAFLVALLIGLPFCRRVYWKHQVGKEMQLIRWRQLPTSGAESGRVYPVVPLSENAFEHLQAAGPITRPSSRFLVGIGPSTYAVRWFKEYRTNELNAWSECFLLTTNNQAQLSALRGLSRYEKAYMDPAVAAGWRLPVDISGYISLAVADLILTREDRDHARMLSDLRSLFAVARLTGSQPLHQLQDVCQQCLTVIGTALEFVLTEHSLQSEELLEFQSELEKIHANNAWLRTLSLERALIIEGWGQPDRTAPGGPPILGSALLGLFSAVGSSDQLLARTLRSYARAETAEGRSALLNNPTVDLVPRSLMLLGAYVASPLFSMAYTDTMLQARLKLYGVALAVERYQLEHQHPPTQLQEIVPQYLERAPADPFSGQLMEIKEDHGLLVRSCGEKGGYGANERLIFRLTPVSVAPLRPQTRTP